MEKWIIGHNKPEAVLQHICTLAASAQRPLIICFDYFDTLVTRCVEPEHTKRLASQLMSRLLRGHFSGELLYSRRKEIESHLCLSSSKLCGELEFSFEDLGTELWTELKKQDVHNALPARAVFIKDLLALEVAVEKAVQHVCPEVLQVLLALHRLKMTILLISDFYLPEKEFQELITWHNLANVFAKVYVSSECGRSKGSGRIYPLVCADLGAEPGQLLMIGDNPHADVLMAGQQGLKTLCLQRRGEGNKGPVLRKRTKNAASNPIHMFNQIEPPSGVPFAEIGFSLWRFTHRLFEELHRKNVGNVFFLSKEGEFLKRIFDQYQLALFGQEKIKSHYFLASRKATFIASLRSIDEEDFSRLLNHYRDISIRDFLQSLNLESGIISCICAEISEDCDQRLTNLCNHPTFRELLRLNSFRNAFETRKNEQRHCFISYLDSFSVDYQREGLHLVDVGWKGSIQDNIYYALATDVMVQGYYIGSLNATERVGGNCKQGLLFDNYPQLSPFYNVFNCNRSLFEMVLGASHGSAISYQQGEIEQEKEGSTDSHSLVVTHDIEEERQLFEHQIKPLQSKLFELTAAMNRAYIIQQTIPTEEWFARHHARMSYFPKPAEIEWFESLYHYENFGIFEFTTFNTLHRFSLLERLGHLKNIVKDPAVLESGVWPPIILRRFGVGFWQIVDGWRRYRREFGRMAR